MKKLILLVIIMAFLWQNPLYANAKYITNNINNKLYTEQISSKQSENSNQLVEITKVNQNDESSIIYTGTLDGYAQGVLNYVDFSRVQSVIVLDWNGSDIIYIKPIRETKENESLSNQTNNFSTINNRNFMSLTSDFSITSQIKINGINVGENGLRIIDNANLSCTFDISNQSSEEKTLTALLATYAEDGTMQNVKIVEVDVPGENIKSIQIIYQFDAENEFTGKLMMWESLSSMIPIKATVDFTQTSGVNAYYYDLDNRLLQIDKMNGQTLMYSYDKMGNLLTKRVRTEETENE